ncbi:MAG: FG-GAP-like repeat-containing protein [Phycisphaerales bacterium]|nr:FG-GAP-like repeat-containing protein [Phycisphaerales bacterium]
MRQKLLMAALVGTLPGSMTFGQGWVDFDDETGVRLQSDADVGVSDSQEKDYAVGDLDRDGDDDLICVRKEPFTSTGRDINILFMNENGVLVDRTESYARQSDVSGDQGFLTPTNDRDVAIVDVNGDDWPDVVTATTLTDNDAKHLSHPRVYINLGEVDGLWQGLRYEDARIPQMHPTAGPRFCSVAAGDIDGDGDMDLYFGDYDSGTTQIYDYNNKLLINDGNGYFADESDLRLTEEMRLSAFGAASVMADMNADGALDIVKQTSLNPPQHIAVTYNNPNQEGVFNGYQIVDELAPYFVSVGDLNGDGRLDMVVTDDGVDTYYLNQGNGGNGQAQFAQRAFSSVTNGFGGDSYLPDLNNDGHLDVIITDVDVDIAGCSRVTHIFRNRGESPEVTFEREATGISDAMLTGVHDTAIIDINGDGWLDMVMGRCDTTEVWINQPPVGLVFAWTGGIPSYLPPGMPMTVGFEVQSIGGVQIEAESGQLWFRVAGGAWVEVLLSDLGGNFYSGELPAVDCAESLEFYASARTDDGTQYNDPAVAPAQGYGAVGADGVETLVRLDFEVPATGWSVWNDDSLETGGWEQVDPIGTLFGTTPSQPEDDATNGADAVQCWITENGSVGGSVGEADVDGGPTVLTSSLIDLEGTDGDVSYARWFFDSESEDQLFTEISNDDGVTWAAVETTGGTNSAWEITTFRISDFVEPSAQMRIRWVVEDGFSPSVVEAGIDNLQVDVLICDEEVPCLGDATGDGQVSVDDVLLVLGEFGQATDGAADIDGDGVVTVNDLLAIIAAWGPCP